MGKSVFLLPTSSARSNKAQLLRLRDELGAGALKLEGPFSDRDGAVAEIADHVRRRVRCSVGTNEIETTVLTLMHQDVLPPGFPEIRLSQLEVPFVTGLFVPGFSEEQETAGAVAHKTKVTFKGKEARRVTSEELTMLGVSVLRSLGIESYYIVSHFDTTHLDAVLSPLNAKVQESSIPSIGILMGGRLVTTSLSSLDAALLRVLPLSSLETLDNDAALSLLKMRNAWTLARSLMHDMRSRNPEFKGEGTLRAVQAGHTLFESISLWTLEEAQSGVNAAKEMFGKTELGVRSAREIVEDSYVHNFICPVHHMKAAASVLLDEELQGKIQGMPEMQDIDSMREAMEYISGLSCVAKFMAYFDFARLMNRHVHAPRECEDMNGKDAN